MRLPLLYLRFADQGQHGPWLSEALLDNFVTMTGSDPDSHVRSHLARSFANIGEFGKASEQLQLLLRAVEGVEQVGGQKQPLNYPPPYGFGFVFDCSHLQT